MAYRLANRLLFCFLAFSNVDLCAGRQIDVIDQDPQAVGILRKLLSGAGTSPLVSGVSDTTRSGNVRLFWAAGETDGTLLLKCRVRDECRFDFTLPDGGTSWIVSNGAGTYVDVDKSIHVDSRASAFGWGFLYDDVLSALGNRSAKLLYLGVDVHAGASVHHIRLEENAPSPLVAPTVPCARDFYIDANSFGLVSVADCVHLADNVSLGVAREVFFSNYQTIKGISVPMTMTETIYGQPTMTVDFTETSFNSGLTDAVFQP